MARSRTAQLLRLIVEDLEAHRGDPFAPGWRALVVHRFTSTIVLTSKGWTQQVAAVLARVGRRRMRRRFGIDIDPDARIGRRVSIAHQGGILIGSGVVIGDRCLIRHRVTILGRAGEPRPRLSDEVHVGVGARVLGDVSVGEGCRIGANVVLLESLAPWSVAVSPPSRTSIA
jgi:serine O-acetyltransferase